MLDTWPDYEDQQQPARKTVAPYWAVLLAILFGIAVAGALWSGKVYADSSISANDGSVKYVRHDKPCDDADIITHLTRMGAGEYLTQFKKGTLTYSGREWRSCWIEVEEHVISVDEEGAPLQAIPSRLFKEVGGGA